MEKKSFISRLQNLPVAILPTMVGAATLSNMYVPMGYTWVRHLTMWAAAIVVIAYLMKIVCHFNTVKNEYSNTVPASLYAGLTMMTMILGSYVFDYSPVIGKALWSIGLAVHAVHLVIFIYRNIVKGVNINTFVPSWFVTFNGIMVSTVTGAVMNEPTICKFIVYYGITVFVLIMPFMIVRLMKHPVADPMFHTKAIVLAPSSLCVVSYLNIIKAPNAIVVYLLYAAVFLALVYIVINLPKFFSFDFHPGFAGLTFPMAIGIVASNKVAAFATAGGHEMLGNILKQITGIQIYLTTAIIGYVLFKFAMMLRASYKKVA